MGKIYFRCAQQRLTGCIFVSVRIQAPQREEMLKNCFMHMFLFGQWPVGTAMNRDVKISNISCGRGWENRVRKMCILRKRY